MPGKGLHYNPKFFGGGACARGGIPIFDNSLTPSVVGNSEVFAITVDQDSQLWWTIADRRASVRLVYGSYDVDGVMTETGVSATLFTPSAGIYPASGFRVDTLQSTWLLNAESGNTLIYGTYNGAGLPVKVGQIAVGTFPSNSFFSLAIDPVNKLWWGGNDQNNTVVYGSYNGAGVPTVTGSFAVPDRTKVNSISVSPIDGRLWFGGSPSGVTSITTGLYDGAGNVTVFSAALGDSKNYFHQGSVSEELKTIYLYNATDGRVEVLKFDGAGLLTDIGDTVAASISYFGTSVDDINQLVFTGTDGNKAYSGKYC